MGLVAGVLMLGFAMTGFQMAYAVEQQTTTHGNCSPVITANSGDISIICSDETAAKYFQAIINEIKKLQISSLEKNNKIEQQAKTISSLVENKKLSDNPELYNLVFADIANSFKSKLRNTQLNSIDVNYEPPSDLEAYCKRSLEKTLWSETMIESSLIRAEQVYRDTLRRVAHIGQYVDRLEAGENPGPRKFKTTKTPKNSKELRQQLEERMQFKNQSREADYVSGAALYLNLEKAQARLQDALLDLRRHRNSYQDAVNIYEHQYDRQKDLECYPLNYRYNNNGPS